MICTVGPIGGHHSADVALCDTEFDTAGVEETSRLD